MTSTRMLPVITVGAVFAVIISFDELTVSRFLTGPKQVTLAIRFYSGFTHVLGSLVIAESAAMVLLTLGARLLKERLVGLDPSWGRYD